MIAPLDEVAPLRLAQDVAHFAHRRNRTRTPLCCIDLGASGVIVGARFFYARRTMHRRMGAWTKRTFRPTQPEASRCDGHQGQQERGQRPCHRRHAACLSPLPANRTRIWRRLTLHVLCSLYDTYIFEFGELNRVTSSKPGERMAQARSSDSPALRVPPAFDEVGSYKNELQCIR